MRVVQEDSLGVGARGKRLCQQRHPPHIGRKGPPSLATLETKIPPDRRGQEAGLVERGDKERRSSLWFLSLLSLAWAQWYSQAAGGRVESKKARRDGGGRPPTHRPKGATLGGRGRRREAQATAHIRESCFPLSLSPLFRRNSHPPTQNALNPGLPRPWTYYTYTQMMPMPCMPMSDPTHPVPRWPPTGWPRRPRPSPPRRKRPRRPRRRRPRRPRRPRRRTARSGGPRRRTRSWCGQRSPRSRARGHCFPQRSRSRHFTVLFRAATLVSPPALFFQLEKFSLISFLFFSFRFPFLFRLICNQIFWAGKTGRREETSSVRQYASAGAAQLRRVVCVKGKATVQQEFGRRRHTSFFHFHSHPLSEPKRTGKGEGALWLGCCCFSSLSPLRVPFGVELV